MFQKKLFITFFLEHQSQRFSKSKIERKCHYHEASSSTNDYRGQNNTSYYQPSNYNQCQYYFYYRKKGQAPYRTDYESEKWKNMVLFIV